MANEGSVINFIYLLPLNKKFHQPMAGGILIIISVGYADGNLKKRSPFGDHKSAFIIKIVGGDIK